MHPIRFFDLITLAQAGVYLLLVAVALLQQKALARPRHALALYALVSALWLWTQLAWSRDLLPFLLYDFTSRLPLYGLLLMAAILLWFTRIYLLEEKPGWGWWVLGLAWMAGLLLLDSNLVTTSQVLWTGGGWMIRRQDFTLSGIVLGWCLFTGAATLTTLLAYRRTRQPLQRNRIRYLAMVITLIVVGDAVFLPAFWILGDLLRLLGLLVAAYAVLTPRLPSLRRAVLRSLSYFITTGLALLFYLVALMLSNAAFQNTAGINTWLVGALLATALAALFTPLLSQAQKLLDRLIAGVSHDPARILRQYSQNISNILDLELLAKVVTELIGEALDIPHGSLFTVSYEKGSNGASRYRLLEVKSKSEEEPQPGILSEDGPLANFFRHQRSPLAQGEIDASSRYANIPIEERTWLSDLQMELFVPIHSQDEWIGLLALSPKNSGEPFWDDDQSLLSTLADQTAVALENARLVESLVRLNNDFRQAIAALDKANRNLERLDRTKTEFISIASHELRTPLTLVNAYSQILMEEPALTGNPEYAKMLSSIHTGAQRLHEIVDSMLDVARIDARELQLDLQPVSLGEIIESLHADLKMALKDRNQKFEMVDLTSLPAIQADREALRKVFYHLLVNAIKYTPDGGRITVSGQAVFPTKEVLTDSGVEIVVSDTGIGIDPSMHEVIFTKFYQTGELSLHSSGKTKFKGAGPGLGLAIAKGVVEAHYGRIWVESLEHDENRCPGSQFHVFLPIHQPDKTRPRPPF